MQEKTTSTSEFFLANYIEICYTCVEIGSEII